MPSSSLLIAHRAPAELRSIYADRLGGLCDMVFLEDVSAENRAAALSAADALISLNAREELTEDDRGDLAGLRFVQLLTAGIDHVPFRFFPAGIPAASNAGAYADPMAEHAVAMVLAAAKRLPFEHAEMRAGRFNQFTPNKRLSGATCAILGFGGIGRATARILAVLGMRIAAINRSGRADGTIERVGTMADLDAVLRDADVIVIALPLTDTTNGLIGARELGLMKDDAILINVARGEIIDQGALYRHLVDHPGFTACLDAWWIEPVRHGEFRIDHPFLDLPNIIASPHNSAAVRGTYVEAVRRGTDNMRRWLLGETPLNPIDLADRYD